MVTREVHDEHIAQIFGSDLTLTTPEYVRLIQDAVYLLMDSTVKHKNTASLTAARQRLKDLRIADIAPDDIVAMKVRQTLINITRTEVGIMIMRRTDF